MIFQCPKIWGHCSLIIMCINIGTPKNHHFLFGTNEKVVVLGVPVFKHFRVYIHFRGEDPLQKQLRCPNICGNYGTISLSLI